MEQTTELTTYFKRNDCDDDKVTRQWLSSLLQVIDIFNQTKRLSLHYLICKIGKDGVYLGKGCFFPSFFSPWLRSLLLLYHRTVSAQQTQSAFRHVCLGSASLNGTVNYIIIQENSYTISVGFSSVWLYHLSFGESESHNYPLNFRVTSLVLWWSYDYHDSVGVTLNDVFSPVRYQTTAKHNSA